MSRWYAFTPAERNYLRDALETFDAPPAAWHEVEAMEAELASLPCEVCGDSEYTGTRWPVEINGDASRGWVERCDRCDLYADDIEAALYIAEQEGSGRIVLAKPRGSSDWQPAVGEDE